MRQVRRVSPVADEAAQRYKAFMSSRRSNSEVHSGAPDLRAPIIRENGLKSGKVDLARKLENSGFVRLLLLYEL